VRPIRVLLLGLGGGSMVSGLQHTCQRRSTARHRKGNHGVVGCVITAVEAGPHQPLALCYAQLQEPS
jgi:hypothetical protein